MEIEVVWGTGEGGSTLGAFDSALAAAGIHNYNLVPLSSIVPPDAAVVEAGTHEGRWPVGELVGTVLARHDSTVSGETIAAGLGWARAPEGGVFFEAEAESRANVAALLERGIVTAKERRPGWDWEPGHRSRVVDHTVAESGAAVVGALYRPL